MTVDSTTQLKWKAIKAGKKIPADDNEMDFFESQPEWQNIASKPNPNSCGVRDTYIVWLRS